jgi:ABC-type sugar transport system permease subunit
MAQSISTHKALREWRLYFFIVPALAAVLTFSYFPAASALYHSFFDWSGGDTKEFIGLGNFKRILSDTIFWQSFVTIFILVLANVFKLVPSIGMAVLIHRMVSDRMQYFYRVGVVIPMLVPGIVTLFIWKFFYDPNLGILNTILDLTRMKNVLVWLDGTFGWGIFYADIPIGWLSTPELIIPSLIFWGFPWIGAVGVLIYLAGLQSIGKELYEAADIDGAGPFQKFFYIEFPLILTQVRVTLILLIIHTLQGYGQQFLLLGENGGPARAGMTPGLWMFNRAFFNGEFGYSCALGLVLFVVILALTWVNNKYVRVDK